MTAPQIRPIETSYHGCRFRSRTEARWAVFFDALGVAWEYEREGYALPSGRYLPDFWLPGVDGNAGLAANEYGIWFEVKGQWPTAREQRLGTELRLATGHQVFIAPGPPFDPDDVPERCHAIATEWPDWDGAQMWTRCPKCERIGITMYGNITDLLCSHQDLYPDSDLFGRCPEIMRAVTAARSARFGT